MVTKSAGLRTMVSVLVALISTSARADTLEQVQKKIHELMSSHKSLIYKNHVVSDLDMSGVKMKSQSEQTIEVARQGDVLLSRIEMTTTSTQKIGGQEEKTVTKMISVTDGQYGYTYSEVGDTKSAIRQKLDRSKEFSPFDVMKGFKEQEKTYTFKLKPDETVEGKKCYVIEMSPKDAASAAIAAKVVLSFDKSTGVGVRSTTYDKDGKVTTQSLTTDVKVDPVIPPDHFKFKAPPGVTIQDLPNQ